jgi:hypothetical protein
VEQQIHGTEAELEAYALLPSSGRVDQIRLIVNRTGEAGPKV